MSSVPGAGTIIQGAGPFGQSFTPTLSGIDFVRLNLNDVTPGNALGAIIQLTLRTNNMSGAILATSSPLAL